MVAKTYQGLEIVGDIFKDNGRSYVKIRTKTGSLKAVRWYNEKEYARMYPEDVQETTQQIKTQKEILGFDKGYITIFKGNTYEEKDYFKMNSARYTRIWGWYFISTEKLPNDLPDDVEPVQLPWELVGNEDGNLKSEKEIVAAIESLIYEADNSEWQGNIGDKITIDVIIEKAVPLDGFYGPSTLHTMRDTAGNCYVWTTSAKSWIEGSKHHITGTIKDLSQYKGIKQTVLTRCRES